MSVAEALEAGLAVAEAPAAEVAADVPGLAVVAAAEVPTGVPVLVVAAGELPAAEVPAAEAGFVAEAEAVLGLDLLSFASGAFV